MRLFGILLTQLGLIVAIAAYAFMDTSMSVSLPGASVLGLPQTSEVANLALLFDRALVFGGGCALFLGGVILAAAGTIADASRHTASTEQGDVFPLADGVGSWGKDLLVIVAIMVALGLALWLFARPSGGVSDTSIDSTIVTDLNSAEMMSEPIDDAAGKR